MFNLKINSITPLLLLLSFIIKYISWRLDSSKVIAAINCGGTEYTDSNGVKYEADKYYNGGTSSDHGLSFTINIQIPYYFFFP